MKNTLSITLLLFVLSNNFSQEKLKENYLAFGIGAISLFDIYYEYPITNTAIHKKFERRNKKNIVGDLIFLLIKKIKSDLLQKAITTQQIINSLMKHLPENIKLLLYYLE